MLIVPQEVVESPASFSQRFVASFLDNLIFGPLFFPLLYALGEPDTDGVQTLSGWKALLVLLLLFCYFPLAEGLTGATVGKRWTGLRVHSVSGGPISLKSAIKRRMLDPIDFYLSGGLVAAVMVNKLKSKQRLGDLF